MKMLGQNLDKLYAHELRGIDIELPESFNPLLHRYLELSDAEIAAPTERTQEIIDSVRQLRNPNSPGFLDGTFQDYEKAPLEEYEKYQYYAGLIENIRQFNQRLAVQEHTTVKQLLKGRNGIDLFAPDGNTLLNERRMEQRHLTRTGDANSAQGYGRIKASNHHMAVRMEAQAKTLAPDAKRILITGLAHASPELDIDGLHYTPFEAEAKPVAHFRVRSMGSHLSWPTIAAIDADTPVTRVFANPKVSRHNEIDYIALLPRQSEQPSYTKISEFNHHLHWHVIAAPALLTPEQYTKFKERNILPPDVPGPLTFTLPAVQQYAKNYLKCSRS